MITLTIEAQDADELMLKLRGFMRDANGGANVVALTAAPAPVAREDASPKPAMTVDELRAGMTLKETQTATLGDGGKAAPGDNVICNGEEWVVHHTYRGRLIAATEDNRADILMAENCSAVPQEDQPPKPRAGTASALLNQPDPNQRPADQAKAIGAAAAAPSDGPIDPAFASKLRDEATSAVSNETVTVDAVFEKLRSLGGAGSIDELTAANGAAFSEWLTAATQPKKMGF